MPNTPVPAEIEAIRKREQAATKGSWYYAPDTMTGGADGGQLRFGKPYGRPSWTSFGFRDYMGEKPDGEFMAHAREDIPYLLAALDAATAERDALAAKRDDKMHDLFSANTKLTAERDAALARVRELEVALRRFQRALCGEPSPGPQTRLQIELNDAYNAACDVLNGRSTKEKEAQANE